MNADVPAFDVKKIREAMNEFLKSAENNTRNPGAKPGKPDKSDCADCFQWAFKATTYEQQAFAQRLILENDYEVKDAIEATEALFTHYLRQLTSC